MNFEELLDLLEIDSPDDFAYFEHFAAIIECDEEIPYEMFFKVLADVDSETLVELTDNYFDEVLQGMPDDSIEIYTLLNTIRQALLGLAKTSQTREDRVLYIDELYRFRIWYIFDSVVYCKRDNTTKQVTLIEALSLSRLEKLNEEQYSYDFSECLDYEIDEYSLTIDATIDEDYDDMMDEDEDDDLYEDGLIDRDYPVIDGEEYEEEEY